MPDGTVVISRAPEDSSERADFENTARDAAVDAGGDVLVVPHVYYLTPEHEACETLRGLEGPVALGAWLHTRAARWTLDALNIEPGGPVTCLNLGDFCCGGKAAEALLETLPQPDVAKTASTPSIREVDAAVEQRWYPVLDYSRCTDCRQCLEFCLFGVFSSDDDGVVASNPKKCKPGCPACARVCPQGAIMFPHYTEDDGISGAPDAVPTGQDADIAEYMRRRCSDSAEETADEEACCPDNCCESDEQDESAGKQKKSAEGESSRAGKAHELDDLISELDDLDD